MTYFWFFASFVTRISNLVIYLHRSQIWEISISWDVVWNAHDQSDCRILKSTIYIERNHEIAWVSKFQLATWINQIHENWKMIQFFFERAWSNMFVTTLVMGSCHKTLKLAVSQEKVNRIVWFSSCSYKIRKAKSCYFNNLLIVVKNGCCHLDHSIQNLVLSQNESMNWANWCRLTMM